MAVVDQQQELMRYFKDLNGWLERDVHTRRAEFGGVSAQVDRLRDEVSRFGPSSEHRNQDNLR